MQTEQLQKQNWMSLSGRILEGGFELKDLIEADETRALFRVRVLGDRELVATALFRRLDPASADRQVDLWQTVRSLRDPHLNSPLGCGTTDLNGTKTPYVVLRQPDESLGGVLRERPLTQPEAKEALLNIAKALEVLHLSGLAHGNVSPGETVAIGDSIRLSGEGVRAIGVAPGFELKAAGYLAPESKGMNLTPEADVWSVGATVFEMLTQKEWADDQREKADALPEPFATIALRCLVAEPRERCHLAEVAALARGEIKPAPRPKPAPVPATVVPINEKEIHSAGLNGTASVGPISEPKTEAVAPPRIEEAKAQSQTAAAGAASGSKPALAPNGTTKRESPVVAKPPSEAKVEPLRPERKPTPITTAQPAAKVQPIQQGPAPTPFTAKPQRPDDTSRRDEVVGNERPSKIWIWAGVAVLAVVLLIWALRPKHTTPATTGPATRGSSAQTRTGGNAWETKTLQPDGTASNTPSSSETKTPPSSATPSPKAAIRSPAQTVPAPVKEAAAKPEGNSANGNVWRTVLYTYNRQSAAEEKAKALNGQHSDLHAEVFSPSGKGPYLVCAGGRMSKEDATQIRRRAVSLGLPRDSYIQNFKH